MKLKDVPTGELFTTAPNRRYCKFTTDFGKTQYCRDMHTKSLVKLPHEIEVNAPSYPDCDPFAVCTCATMPMPPCGTCTSGGWCDEHGTEKQYCGCE